MDRDQADQAGQTPDNPGSLVSKAPESDLRRTRVLSTEEYERLQAHASASLRLICEMTVTTLLRKGDLELLTRENYDPVTRTLSGIQTKTIVPGRSRGRAHCIPIEDPEIEKQIMATEERLLDFTNFCREFEAAVNSANLKILSLRICAVLGRRGSTRREWISRRSRCCWDKGLRR